MCTVSQLLRCQVVLLVRASLLIGCCQWPKRFQAAHPPLSSAVSAFAPDFQEERLLRAIWSLLLAPCSSLLTTHSLLFTLSTLHYSLLTYHSSLFLTHHSPLITHHSPLTIHHPPLALATHYLHPLLHSLSEETQKAPSPLSSSVVSSIEASTVASATSSDASSSTTSSSGAGRSGQRRRESDAASSVLPTDECADVCSVKRQRGEDDVCSVKRQRGEERIASRWVAAAEKVSSLDVDGVRYIEVRAELAADGSRKGSPLDAAATPSPDGMTATTVTATATTVTATATTVMAAAVALAVPSSVATHGPAPDPVPGSAYRASYSVTSAVTTPDEPRDAPPAASAAFSTAAFPTESAAGAAAAVSHAVLDLLVCAESLRTGGRSRSLPARHSRQMDHSLPQQIQLRSAQVPNCWTLCHMSSCRTIQNHNTIP